MSYCKKPCKNCPFRNDIRPYLHPERASELAYQASNPYSDFICHATIEYEGGEDIQGRPLGDYSKSKTCAGFLTLRAQAGENTPNGFEPSWDNCYIDEWDMITAHQDEWESK